MFVRLIQLMGINSRMYNSDYTRLRYTAAGTYTVPFQLITWPAAAITIQPIWAYNCVCAYIYCLLKSIVINNTSVKVIGRIPN